MPVHGASYDASCAIAEFPQAKGNTPPGCLVDADWRQRGAALLSMPAFVKWPAPFDISAGH